ncbi:MAG: DUF3108 domain-containing protein [Gemmatimonadaceae bacterium]|nr:DUF3108 domain-containing protein [Gemmatimonadaceae bacterium]
MISPAIRAVTLGLALFTTGYDTPGGRTSVRQHDGARAGLRSVAPEGVSVPFGAGEKSTFDVRFGGVRVGSSALEVIGVESVRGRDTWHTSFTVHGGAFFYRVNDVYESWIDTRTLNSLLFIRQIEEGTREREHTFEIMPERGLYVERTRKGSRTLRTVAEPLDEAAFLYFVRTVPLVVGRTYDFNRYFMPDRNPVRIRVLRKERVTVPAGTYNAIVLQPIIKTRGIFSENGKAEVWLSDDPARMLLQIKSRLSFGSLNLYLRSYIPATAQAQTLGR